MISQGCRFKSYYGSSNQYVQCGHAGYAHNRTCTYISDEKGSALSLSYMGSDGITVGDCNGYCDGIGVVIGIVTGISIVNVIGNW